MKYKSFLNRRRFLVTASGLLVPSIIGRAQSPLITGSGIDWKSASVANPLPNITEGWHFETSVAGTKFVSIINTPTNDFVFFGGPNITVPAGKHGNCCLYNTAGATGGVSAGSNATLNAGAGVSFTYSLWLNLVATPTNNSGLSKWDYLTPDTAYTLGWASGNLQWVVTNVANNSNVTINPTPNPGTGAWHLVVFGYDDSVQKSFTSLDGAATQTASVVGVRSNTISLELGQYAVAGSAATPNCNFDELYLWKRVLSAAEITYLWNGGTGNFYTP